MEVEERWSPATPLVENELQRFDERGLARIILPQQDVHTWREVHGFVAKATIVLDVNIGQVHNAHNVPQARS
jgi:hypothetical protein